MSFGLSLAPRGYSTIKFESSRLALLRFVISICKGNSSPPFVKAFPKTFISIFSFETETPPFKNIYAEKSIAPIKKTSATKKNFLNIEVPGFLLCIVDFIPSDFSISLCQLSGTG